MKIYLFAFLLILPISLGADERVDTFHLSGAGEEANLDTAVYTDHAAWNPELIPYLSKETRILTNWQEKIRLPEPPANSSERTRAELGYLKNLESVRSDDQKNAILRELKVIGMKIGSYEMGPMFEKETSRPETRKLLLAGMHDMEIIIFKTKNHFNRVRPTHLDPDIHPSIEVPGHPAYPSGHATQAHVLAYLFCELDPESSEGYLRSAAHIARNREIAGVHYPSDSAAGQLLARQIVDRLLEHEGFRSLLEKARKEWE